jgi:hypothetical protein
MDDEIFKQHVAQVAGTESGRIILNYLMGQCGWNMPPGTVNPQTHEINSTMTAYNLGRLDIWMQLRKLIPIDNLVAIEHNQQITETMKREGKELHDRRNDSDGNTTEPDGTSSSGRLKRRDIERESAEFIQRELKKLDITIESNGTDTTDS